MADESCALFIFIWISNFRSIKDFALNDILSMRFSLMLLLQNLKELMAIPAFIHSTLDF